MKSTRRVSHRKGTDGAFAFRADACFPIYIYITRVLARCLLYCGGTIKARPDTLPLSSPTLRVSAVETFPFYWMVETSIARGMRERDSALEYIGIRIGWRAGTQGCCSWTATHHLHACPDRQTWWLLRSSLERRASSVWMSVCECAPRVQGV